MVDGSRIEMVHIASDDSSMSGCWMTKVETPDTMSIDDCRKVIRLGVLSLVASVCDYEGMSIDDFLDELRDNQDLVGPAEEMGLA